MSKIGSTFQKIRQSKHISLRQAAGQVCSPSLLSRFENGLTELTANKLFAILDTIHVSLAEFERLLQLDDSQADFIAQVRIARDQNNLSQLEKLYLHEKKMAQKTKQDFHMVNSLIAKAYLKAKQPQLSLDKTESDFLYDWLFMVDVWGNQELELFSVCAILLTTDLYTSYTQKMLARVPADQIDQRKLHTILLNGFMVCVTTDNLDKASYFQKQIEKHYYSERDAYYRILYQWTCGLLLAKMGQPEAGLRQMEDAIAILDAINCQHSADYYRQLTAEHFPV
ncbi:Rgg/GadR/MutR family transcriptional regulator [Streptococcus merionis]|uniref:Rgg/GadR/MutR family transcriptional regulator n=1 Tax=Streptococcus merionis TaxID=400065 RepID=UPI0026ED6A01|nr:Rgg/GadR/MutR family transcriptional regulator [Streptococcus merionis]